MLDFFTLRNQAIKFGTPKREIPAFAGLMFGTAKLGQHLRGEFGLECAQEGQAISEGIGLFKLPAIVFDQIHKGTQRWRVILHETVIEQLIKQLVGVALLIAKAAYKSVNYQGIVGSGTIKARNGLRGCAARWQQTQKISEFDLVWKVIP